MKEVITIDFEPQALCTDMPLFRPVDRFDNDVLFQATKDHSAGQEFDVTKKGNRDSNILGSCCYRFWVCSFSEVLFWY